MVSMRPGAETGSRGCLNWLEPAGTGCGRTGLPSVKSGVCGPDPLGAPLGLSPSSPTARGLSREPGPGAVTARRLRLRRVFGQLCAPGPASPQMVRWSLDTWGNRDWVCGIRAWKEMWSVVPSPSFLPRGSRLL